MPLTRFPGGVALHSFCALAQPDDFLARSEPAEAMSFPRPFPWHPFSSYGPLLFLLSAPSAKRGAVIPSMALFLQYWSC